MSKTTLYEVNADGKGLVLVTGRFAHPTTVSSGNGFTVVDHATAGRYDITFDDQYSGFVSCVASIEADTHTDADGWTLITQNYTAGANPTLTIMVYPSYNAANPTPDDLAADCFVNFIAVFRNTSVTT
tara:strand:+ start:397 stop:780 length:384 start_codon:yes stop_codon:yes gene_type:complete